MGDMHRTPIFAVKSLTSLRQGLSTQRSDRQFGGRHNDMIEGRTVGEESVDRFGIAHVKCTRLCALDLCGRCHQTIEVAGGEGDGGIELFRLRSDGQPDTRRAAEYGDPGAIERLQTRQGKTPCCADKKKEGAGLPRPPDRSMREHLIGQPQGNLREADQEGEDNGLDDNEGGDAAIDLRQRYPAFGGAYHRK